MAALPDAQAALRRPNWGLRLRLILMPLVIAGLLAWKFWGEGAASRTVAQVAPDAALLRPATAAEWAQPIAELGRQRLAKQLMWLTTTTTFGDPSAPRRNGVDARGELVWWQDDVGEAVSYIPAPGEPASTGPMLMLAIHDGSAVLLERHGDPALRTRLGELPHDRILPSGWTILVAP